MKLSVAALVGLASCSLFVDAQLGDNLPSLRGRFMGRDPAPADNTAIAADNTVKAAPVSASSDWWEADKDPGQHPWNIASEGNTISLTIKPDEESVKINSKEYFSGGTFTVRMKSAAAMPGVVTAMYLASGAGRTGDGATGQQDEIDFEVKGNDPNKVQTNVFMSGEESLELIDVGSDTSAAPHTYSIEWDGLRVRFFVDDRLVRTKYSYRRMKPLQLFISVWTTTGGWPGVKKWAGETNWGNVNRKPIVATFEVLSLPHAR